MIFYDLKRVIGDPANIWKNIETINGHDMQMLLLALVMGWVKHHPGVKLSQLELDFRDRDLATFLVIKDNQISARDLKSLLEYDDIADSDYDTNLERLDNLAPPQIEANSDVSVQGLIDGTVSIVINEIMDDELYQMEKSRVSL